MTGVLFSRRHSSNDGTLEVRFTDGRTFQMREYGASKFVLEPLEVAVADPPSRGDLYDVMNLLMQLPDMLSNWIASDSWRLDPNECWILQHGGEIDSEYVVLSDGDMKTRHLILRRPGNINGGLESVVLKALVDEATEAGWVYND